MSTTQAIEAVVQTEQVVDSAVIERYRQRRASLVKVLVDAYLEEAPRYFQDLRKAVSTGDAVGARAAAHGLKSCSFNLGAIRLAKLCQETEKAAVGQNMGDVSFALDRMGPVLFDTEEALKAARMRAGA